MIIEGAHGVGIEGGRQGRGVLVRASRACTQLAVPCCVALAELDRIIGFSDVCLMTMLLTTGACLPVGLPPVK